MGLIKCLDCNKEVSDRAKVCLQCGAPVGAGGVVTTEGQGKEWKLLKLIGGTLMFVSIFGLFTGSEWSPFTGGASLFLLIFASLGSWWKHG